MDNHSGPRKIQEDVMGAPRPKELLVRKLYTQRGSCSGHGHRFRSVSGPKNSEIEESFARSLQPTGPPHGPSPAGEEAQLWPGVPHWRSQDRSLGEYWQAAWAAKAVLCRHHATKTKANEECGLKDVLPQLHLAPDELGHRVKPIHAKHERLDIRGPSQCLGVPLALRSRDCRDVLR